jgi:hypothetical protein
MTKHQGQCPSIAQVSIRNTHGLPMKAMLFQSKVMMDMPGHIKITQVLTPFTQEIPSRTEARAISEELIDGLQKRLSSEVREEQRVDLVQLHDQGMIRLQTSRQFVMAYYFSARSTSPD